MKIAVLAGGMSPERNVSLTSGSLIAAALRRRGHTVCLVDVYVGLSQVPTDLSSLFTLQNDATFSVDEQIPDLDCLMQENGGREELVGPHIINLCREADVTFLALHGAMGENGQLQALLDIYNIAYTGSGYLGSAMAMDKDIAKTILSSVGIRVPRGVRFAKAEVPDPERILCEVGLPAVVKPASSGSSVGVSIVNTKEELIVALDAANTFEDDILVEECIIGRELTCGILEGRVLPPVEIIPKNGFYDYKNKYQVGATTELCPAPLSDEETKAVQDATAKGFDALRLSSYARFDFILTKNGDAVCLEANTLPGMTPTSLLPQEAAAVGMDYDTLCEVIALSALKK